MSQITKGLSIRATVRVTVLAVVVCATALTGATAAFGNASAVKVHKVTNKTFTLPGHSARTFNVPYPDALKFAGARYSCTATVSGLGKKYVKILSRGSALGGSQCRVKARNNAKLPSIDTTARVRVTATTTYSTRAPTSGLG